MHMDPPGVPLLADGLRLISVRAHSTRLLLLRLNSLKMEDFLLCLAFFTPVQHRRGSCWDESGVSLE